MRLALLLLALSFAAHAQISFNGTGTCTYSTASGNLVVSCPPVAVLTPVPQPPPPPPPTPPAPPAPVGCSSAGYVPITLNNGGASGPWTQIQLAPNTVGSFSLPPVNAHHQSGVFYPGVVAMSPSGGNLVEATISKCRGEINPFAGACYMTTQTVDGASIQWVGVATTYAPATLEALGYCNAPASAGPWYVNIRYQYQTCSAGICGYQWWWLDSWL